MRARVLTLAAIALTAGCNSILDIPERPLLVDDDTGVDTGLQVDSTTDTIVFDTGTIDSTVEETAADSTIVDSADSAAADAVDADTTEPTDTMVTDTTVTDTLVTDTTAADTADTAPVDTGTTDTATADTADTSAPTCGVTGKPCCGSPTAGMCDTNSVCASGTCIAAAGSCVRASDCPGVCTGPGICAGNVCFSCGAAAGTGALWSECTASSQCLRGPCDRTRGVCSSACAPGITGDADCAALDPKAICVAPSINVTSGGTTASGFVGFCARSCRREGDCRSSETCRGSTNNLENRIDIACAPVPSSATVDLGGTCTTSSECKRGSCLTSGSTSKCTAFCVTAADCTAGTWNNCGAVTYSRPGGGTQIVNVCVP